MKSSTQWITGAAVVAALIGVFYLYTRPDFLLQMSNQLWGCF